MPIKKQLKEICLNQKPTKVKLSSHIDILFPEKIKLRGADYFKNNQIYLLSEKKGEANFLVHGTQTYSCEFSWEESPQLRDFKKQTDFLKKFHMHCDCPYFYQESHCKHLWAAALYFDKTVSAACFIPEKEIMKNRSVDRNWQTAVYRVQDEIHMEQSLQATPSDCFYGLKIKPHDQLEVHFYQKQINKNGVEVLRALWIDVNDLNGFAPSDAELIWMLSKNNFNATYDNPHVNSCKIPESAQKLILKKLCESKKFFIMHSPQQNIVSELAFLNFEEPDLDLKFKLELQGQKIHIRAVFENEHDSHSFENLQFLNSDGTAVTNKSSLVRAKSKHKPWLSSLDEFHDLMVPLEDKDLLIPALYNFESIPDIDIAPKLGWTKTETATPIPKLIVGAESGEEGFEINKNQALYASVHFKYEQAEVASLSNQEYAVDKDHKNIISRNYEAESLALSQVETYSAGGVSYNWSDKYNLKIDGALFSEAVAELLDQDWEVEAHGKKISRAKSYDFSIKSGVDWFDLKGEIQFESGEILTLDEWIKASKSRSGIISLTNGGYGMLPEEWLSKYSGLSGAGVKLEDGSLRFTRAQGLLLNTWFDKEGNLKKDPEFKKFQRDLKKVKLNKKTPALKSFGGTLREYQEEGLAWLDYLHKLKIGGILADDMGLGKTIQVLALLHKSKSRKRPHALHRPSLIIVPKTLVHNWQEELLKFAPKLSKIVYTGLERHEFMDQHILNADVVITTYHTLRNDFERFKEIIFNYIILDEAQNIKNEKAQISLACKALTGEHRLALTGTPIENSILDLFSILDFANPGLISNNMKREMASPAAEDEDLKKLAQSLSPMILRRTKQEVLTDLPDKIEKTVKCKMSPRERRHYDKLKKYYQLKLNKKIKSKGFAKSKIEVLEALLRLRQAACHPNLVPGTKKQGAFKKSAKLEFLSEQIESVISSGNKCLVFSQFTSFLEIIGNDLDKSKIKYSYLDGKTRNRQAVVNEFENSKERQVFLISLKAGGVGLNLTSANYVFILDPWWNPASEAQAVDRTHRIGQNKKVFAYKVIAEDTVEEKILELQKSKRELTDSVINSQSGVLKQMTSKDLEFLLE